jgi:hypothetical protein
MWSAIATCRPHSSSGSEGDYYAVGLDDDGATIYSVSIDHVGGAATGSFVCPSADIIGRLLSDGDDIVPYMLGEGTDDGIDADGGYSFFEALEVL